MKAPKYFYAMTLRDALDEDPGFHRFPDALSRDAWVGVPDQANRLPCSRADIYHYIGTIIRRRRLNGLLDENALWQLASTFGASRLRDIAEAIQPGRQEDVYKHPYIQFPKKWNAAMLSHRDQFIVARLEKHPLADRPASVDEIAWELGLSPQSVRNRVKRIHDMLTSKYRLSGEPMPRRDNSKILPVWREAVARLSAMEADIAEMEAWLQ